MAFERREGNIGGNITRYADRHLTKCPYCKAIHPLWLSDAKPIKIEGENDSISFQFKCPRCNGIIEYVSESEKAFEINDEFKSIKMIDPGRGTYNLNLLNVSLSPDQIYALINNFGVTTTSQHVSPDSNYGYSTQNRKNKTSDSASDPRKTHALIGMILGIFGLVSCFFYGTGILYCIPGLVLSIMGLKSTKNHGKAVAGLTTSIIGLALAGLAIILWTLAWLPFFVFF